MGDRSMRESTRRSVWFKIEEIELRRPGGVGLVEDIMGGNWFEPAPSMAGGGPSDVSANVRFLGSARELGDADRRAN